jgi:hypothetical protein
VIYRDRISKVGSSRGAAQACEACHWMRASGKILFGGEAVRNMHENINSARSCDGLSSFLSACRNGYR